MTAIKPDPILTLPEIEASVRKILEANDIKPGTKKARTIECSFIQGMMVADTRYAKHTYLVICLLTGRSVLDS